MKTSGYCELRSDRLIVEIAKPGTAYAGSRFEWDAFITQVYLDRGERRFSGHTFCMAEDIIPGAGTGGIGLCGEFGMNKPVGMDEVGVGGLFPKLGVGTIRRFNDRPNNPYNNYELVEPCSREIDQPSESELRMTAVNPECNGYAAKISKAITVVGNVLKVAQTLENTGSKVIETEHYAHNFLGIDGYAIGPSYRLNVSFEPEPPKDGRPPMMPGSPLMQNGRDITWRYTPQTAFYTRSEKISVNGPAWTLREVISGCSVSETDDFDPAYMAVWGTGTVVSAEAFFEICVEPGGSVSWTRTYKFD